MEDAILAALGKVQDESKDTITLASGIVLRIKAVPSFIVSRGLSAIEAPRPPRVLVDEENDIWEDNIADPDYALEQDAWAMKRLNAVFKIYVGLGTEFVSAPHTLSSPGDNVWADRLTAVGIPVSRNPAARYVDWITLYALTNVSEMTAVVTEVMRRSGTLEADVLEAVNFFRDRALRATDSGTVRVEHDQDWNNVSPISGANGAGVRGTGVGNIQRLHMEGMAENRTA